MKLMIMNFMEILTLYLVRIVVGEHVTVAAEVTLKLRIGGKELNLPKTRSIGSFMTVIVKRTLTMPTHKQSQ